MLVGKLTVKGLALLGFVGSLNVAVPAVLFGTVPPDQLRVSFQEYGVLPPPTQFWARTELVDNAQ
jgi:hypothetical protein